MEFDLNAKLPAGFELFLTYAYTDASWSTNALDPNFGFQILNQPQATFEVHHPAEILVITQTAAAVLDVWLLHGHRAAVFVAARRLIFDPLGNVFVDKRLHAFVVHLLLHPAKQTRLAGYQPGFDQSRFGLHILVGLLHAILHAPHGVPDLQAQIP